MIQPVQQELYAVIGHPVTHSLSPAMMNRAFAVTGYGGRYLAFQVTELDQDLELLHRLGIKGISVTIPHKERVIKWCETIDETAAAIGAVNTLRWTRTSWEGLNTDWLGVSEPLRKMTRLATARSLVIGAGGAARAAAYALVREGANTVITNRSTERGARLAAELGCDFVPVADVAAQRFDLVVQCTSVGMAGNESPRWFPDQFFGPGMVVMDVVYRPVATEFLKQARQAGCRVLNGLEMLLHQGAAQFLWWTGIPAPQEDMRAALLQALDGETDDSNH